MLALQAEHITFWWITLGMGAVVIAAVIVLLSLLVSFVDDIDQNLKDAWDTATRLAANTATLWQLRHTGARAQDIANEAGRHIALLDAKLGGRR